jgi:hypothetical protein
MPIPENLLIELRAELADVRGLLIEALADFTLYQEGLLKLHEREQTIARFYRKAFIGVTIVLALFIGFGTSQIISTKHIARQGRQVSDQNNQLLREVDCVVRASATLVPGSKEQSAAFLKCVQK